MDAGGYQMSSPVAIPIMSTDTYTVYDCLIPEEGSDFRLRLIINNSGDMSTCRVETDWKLHTRLHEEDVTRLLDRSADVHIFLQDLSTLINEYAKKTGATVDMEKPDIDVARSVLSQLENIGWENVSYVDPSFKKVILQSCNALTRNHLLVIKLTNEKISCNTDLPISTDFHINQTKQVNIQSLMTQFENLLKKCEDFWLLMSDIDENTWVLEPAKTLPSHTYRRLAIDTNASLLLKVNPEHARMLPDCRFLGADYKIKPLKEKLNLNIFKWDVDRSLLENLEDVLDISFPSPTNTSKETFNVDCGICYAHKLENELPDKVCNDTRCGQAFHLSCLYEWLRSLPSSRQSFNTIFGECPFCSKPITVKMPLSM